LYVPIYLIKSTCITNAADGQTVWTGSFDVKSGTGGAHKLNTKACLKPSLMLFTQVFFPGIKMP
jgi:hypothetical protein